jgi:hypothetical protein
MNDPRKRRIIVCGFAASCENHVGCLETTVGRAPGKHGTYNHAHSEHRPDGDTELRRPVAKGLAALELLERLSLQIRVDSDATRIRVDRGKGCTDHRWTARVGAARESDNAVASSDVEYFSARPKDLWALIHQAPYPLPLPPHTGEGGEASDRDSEDLAYGAREIRVDALALDTEHRNAERR